MRKYLSYELSIRLTSVRFWLMVALYVLVSFVPIWPELELFLGASVGPQTYPISYFWFIPYAQTPIIWIALMTLSGMVTSTIMYDDLTEGFIRSLIYRTGFKKYVYLKLLLTILLAICYSLVANMIILTILGIWFPYRLSSPEMVEIFASSFAFFEVLELLPSVWFYIFHMGLIALHTAWYAMFTTAVSLSIRNRLAVYLMPLFIYSFLNNLEVLQIIPRVLSPLRVFSNRPYIEVMLYGEERSQLTMLGSMTYRFLFFAVNYVAIYWYAVGYLERSVRYRELRKGRFSETDYPIN